MKNKHTAGPWRRETYLDRIAIQTPSGVNIAQVIREEDSRLIAAAPELLRALEEAELTLSNYTEDGKEAASGTLKIIRAAIAKAKGE